MPCAGGTATINYGMIPKFQELDKNSPTYTQDWKKLLRVQAAHDPATGITQDILPIAPFSDEDGLYQAEWKIECFMRDVLVPLAAETQALIIGSATKDATLMMSFGRVAASLETKYGGVGEAPWTMLGLTDASLLTHSLDNSESTANFWYSMCPRWQDQITKIKRAKAISDLIKAKGNRPGAADTLSEEEIRAQDDAGEEFEVGYDINPFLDDVIVVDCVLEKEGVVKGIDITAKAHLENTMINYFVGERREGGREDGRAGRREGGPHPQPSTLNPSSKPCALNPEP